MRKRARWLLALVVLLAAGIAGAALAATSTTTNTLLGGQTLTAGQMLVSGDDHYELAMQSDGNLVMYLVSDGAKGRAIWSTHTYGNPGAEAVLQGDGNLVLLSASGDTLYSTNTSTAGCTNLVAGEDGNVDLYNAAGPVWESGSINDELKDGEELTAGQRIFSPDEQYELYMETNGDLVLNGPTGVLWTSKTTGTGNYAILQSDGNFVIYTAAHKALFASGTDKDAGDDAVLQNDGNFVIYTSAGKAAYATKTDATRATGHSQFAPHTFAACPTTPTTTTPVATTPSTTPPPGPVVTIPVETKNRALSRLRVRMTLSWTWDEGITRLHAITVHRFPRQAKMSISCKGAGCPEHTLHAVGRRLSRLLHAVDGYSFHAGDRLEIVIAERHFRTIRVGITIVSGAAPRVRVL
jgi:hypothetical protein